MCQKLDNIYYYQINLNVKDKKDEYDNKINKGTRTIYTIELESQIIYLNRINPIRPNDPKEDIKTKLQNLIKISMKIYDSRPKELKFKYKNNSYNISFKDIVYIEKEKDSKRCIIYTKKKKLFC